MAGEGEGKEGTDCPQTLRFWKVRPRTQLLIGAVLVLLIAQHSKHQSNHAGMLCLRVSQIWSHLICGRRLQMLWTDIYLNRVCAKVHEIMQSLQSIFGDRTVETREGQCNLLGMTACGSDWKKKQKTNVLFVGDNINVNQNISTQH